MTEYRAICFDLDGTLLPMDIDEFMGEYFRRIAAFSAAHGLDPELFMSSLKAGTRAMAMSDEDVINKDVFWREFVRIYGEDNLRSAGYSAGLYGGSADGSLDDVTLFADDFYENEFGHIGDGFRANPAVAQAIATLRSKGYPLVLTTMPMFPLRAVRHRLSWAGADPDDFERITSYENSKYVKPRQTYYAENLAAMGLRGQDVLMVGNNTVEDLSFMDLGADAFLVTDWLLDPIDFDVKSVKHGSFADFAKWCEELPDCGNPAESIRSGAVDRDAMEAAFRENAVRDIDDDEVTTAAKRLADDIASH